MAANTTNTGTVTDEQAQAVLQAIVDRYRVYFEAITSSSDGHVVAPPLDLPVIKRGEDGHAVIWWLEGPSDWAHQVATGGSTEEDRVLFAAAGKEFGAELTPPEPEPLDFPAGVYVEPYTSYSLGIYPG